jgi:mono/diheme cytochrome c family protein
MTMRVRTLGSLAAGLLLASAAVFSQTPARPAAPQATAPVTFADTIAPIVYANCVGCHRPGEAAPFSLLTYEDVAKRGSLIAQVTASRYMPPWHAEPGFGDFVGERRLTDAQIASIAAWVKGGMPRGNLQRMPPAPSFTDGWQLGEPDLVLEMPAAYEVPASGPDSFRNFVIPTGVTEDKWIRAIEYRPSARTVVHHAVFAAVPGGSLANRDGLDGRPGFGGLSAVGLVGGGQDSRGLGGWAVGGRAVPLPDGVAMRLDKGADFLLQLHLHPSGKPERERSLVGIHFADRAPAQELLTVEVPALFAIGKGLDIPAGATAYTIADSFELPAGIRVFSAAAHAHYLGKEFKATATLPDGSTRPLLWIRDWNFNWQDTYVYNEPFVLPKGTRIDVTIVYDNSADNPRNPISPPRRARWGEQSLDEMGAVALAYQLVDAGDRPAVNDALAARFKATVAAAGKEGTLGRFLARTKASRQPMQQLTIFDRSGAVVTRVGDPGPYSQVAFSPDASRLAVVKGDPDTGAQDVWTYDIATGKGTPVTSDEALDSAPVWSPDGSSIAYVSQRDAGYAIYRKPVSGGAEELLYRHAGTALIVPTDWSADGKYLTFWEGDAMFLLPIEGDRTPIALDRTTYRGRGGRFSPDGKFLAYNSNRSGTFQVYLRPLAFGAAGDAGEERQVSEGGVGGIFFRRDGRELFYLAQPGQVITAVELDGAGAVRPGSRTPLFKLPTPILAVAQLSSVASPDGQRFAFAVTITPAR